MDERRAPTGPGIRVYGWQWGRDEDRRPGLPWVGIFLVIFGAILLLEQALPQYRELGNVALLAAGLASLVVWVLRRGGGRWTWLARIPPPRTRPTSGG